MRWDRLHFGQYKGRTLPAIIGSDPDWFYWASEKDIFRQPLKVQAQILDHRSRRIILKGRSRNLEFDWVFDDMGFVELIPVPASREAEGALIRTDCIDLSLLRRVRHFRRESYERLMDQVRRLIFGDVGHVSPKRWEAFFSDPANFAQVSPG